MAGAEVEHLDPGTGELVFGIVSVLGALLVLAVVLGLVAAAWTATRRARDTRSRLAELESRLARLEESAEPFG